MKNPSLICRYSIGALSLSLGFWLTAPKAVAESPQTGTKAAAYISNAQNFFQQQRFRQALDFYLQAQQLQPNNTELYFNIAICRYHLKQYGLSTALLSQLHKQLPNNSKIAASLALSRAKLAQQAPKTQKPSKHNWQLLASYQGGVDDDLIDPTDDSASKTEDSFQQLSLNLQWRYRLSKDQRLSLRGFIHRSDYSDRDNYDFNYQKVNADYLARNPVGVWGLSLALSDSKLGGDDYLRSSSLSLSQRGKFNSDWRWKLELQGKRHQAQSQRFEPLDGEEYRFNASLSQQFTPNWRHQLGYHYSDNRRNNRYTSTSQTSYSPEHQELAYRIQYNKNDWTLQFMGSYRFSHHSLKNIDTTGINHKRDDDRLRFSSKAVWRANKQLELKAEYSYSRVESNIERYDYSNNIVSFGFDWRWSK